MKKNIKNNSKLRLNAQTALTSILFVGINIKDYKLSYFLSNQIYDLQFWLFFIILTALIIIIFLGRIGIFTFTEKISKELRFSELVVKFFFMASNCVKSSGELKDFSAFTSLEWLNLFFNFLIIFLYIKLFEISTDAIKQT